MVSGSYWGLLVVNWGQWGLLVICGANVGCRVQLVNEGLISMAYG